MIALVFVAGALLELAGITLVALDVREASRTFKDMSRPDWPWDNPEALSRSLFAQMALVAAGNTRRRAIGFGLFAGGLIVQTFANIAAL
jgi:hypothetical protein